MAFENFRNIFSCHLGVHNVFRTDHHDRTFSAQTEAAGLYYLNIVFQSVDLYLLFYGIGNLHRTGRSAACYSAD